MSCQISSRLALREGAAGCRKATFQTDIISLTPWPDWSWGLQLCSIPYPVELNGKAESWCSTIKTHRWPYTSNTSQSSLNSIGKMIKCQYLVISLDVVISAIIAAVTPQQTVSMLTLAGSVLVVQNATTLNASPLLFLIRIIKEVITTGKMSLP